MASTGDEAGNEALQMFVQFLSKSSPVHTRVIAMQYLLGCTGTEDGRRFIGSNERYLSSIVELMEDEQTAISKDAYLSLVNLATDFDVAVKLVGLPDFVPYLLKCCISDSNVHADIACMIASNLSRWENCTLIIAKHLTGNDKDVNVFRLVEAFSKKPERLNYVATFLSNMTQLQGVRRLILDKSRCTVQRLLPLLSVDSLVARGGVVGTLRNCCFETEHHHWLLSEEVDLLPRLLLPLAGPEEYDEDDMEKLPNDLQYLGEDKEREPDADIRQMLIETINKLCGKQTCRQYIKSKNTYVIIRDLHKWEKEPALITAIENLVSVLISDEPEAGMEDLDKVDIPKNIEAKLRGLTVDNDQESQH